MPALSLQSGQSTIAINANGHGTRFTLVNTIATSPTAAIVFQAANLGETISTSTRVGERVQFRHARERDGPARWRVTTGVYSGTATNLGILRFASTGAANPDSFVTYDSANLSLRRLADSNYAAGFGTATDNVSVNALTPVTTETANSLRLTAGGSVTILASLTLTSGSLLNNGGGSVTGPGPVNFGTGRNGDRVCNDQRGHDIDGPHRSRERLEKRAGNLTVDSINLSAATGPRTIAVNAGTLTLAGPVVPGTLSSTNTLTYQVSRGATLTAASGLSLGANQILQGGGTQTSGASATATLIGALTVASGGTVRPSTLGGSGPALASPGVLNVTGNVVFQPGGTFEWHLNSVQGRMRPGVPRPTIPRVGSTRTAHWI